MLAPLRAAGSRILGLFSSRRLDHDFHEELDAHLDMLTDQNIRSGMARDEARRRAHLALGNFAELQEIQRERQGLPHMETFYRDFRYAARALRRSPGFTLVAVLTLGLGIGVNTTLFTAFDAVALKPLPVKDPDHVVRIERWFQSGSQGDGQYVFSYSEYLYYSAHARSWSTLGATSWQIPVIAHLTPGGATETLQGELVSGNYFTGLGVDAMLGRTFTPDENRTPGAHPVIILSHPFWRVRFNADPQVLGKTIRLNDTAFTVVGVTSQDFIGTGNPPQVPDFWAPLMMQAELVPGQDWLNSANAGFLKMYGRLQPGASVSQAQSEMTVIARQFEETNRPQDKTVAVTVERATFFGETNTLQFRAFVALLMLIVGMVLLIACANLTNMLLARASGRYREIGVRLALGASRRRLIRQLLTESVLLALLGGVAGMLFAVWASKLLWVSLQQALQAFLWSNVTLVINTSPDMRVFGYTLLVSLVTGIVFGLAPALQASKRDVSAALKEEGSAFGNSWSRSRLRSFLLSGQVAASMLLLLTAGLLVRGLLRAETADPGFETRRDFGIVADYGNDSAKATALYRQVVERLQSLPQVRSVALVYQVPMTGTWTPPLRVEDSHATTQPDRTLANYVSPSYFETLGVPIVRGRTFSRQESEQDAHVAIVSETTARRIWPGEDPLGKHARLDLHFRDQWTDFEVIGVAKDVRNANLSRIDPAYFYFPTALPHWNHILIRTVDDSKATQGAIRSAIEALDRRLAPSLRMGSLEDFVVAKQRLLAKTYAMFAVVLAALALALAGVGIYGVMSYLVSQRVREIGIHMALGARAIDVVSAVVRQGLRPVFIGAIAGILAAAAVNTILKATLVFPGSPDLFFGVSYIDPVTFLSLSAFLAIVAAAASAIPARRATRVDPMDALRYE
jgi:predicted permease